MDIPPLGLGTADVWHGRQLANVRSSSIMCRVLMKIYRVCIGSFYKLKFVFSLVYALKNGYRLIDTSRSYNVEHLIGWAIFLSGVRREEIFITSRVSNREQYDDDVDQAINRSLRLLNTDYIDLYMIHWPVPGHFINTWHVMEKYHKKGVLKHIGVANFHQHHLEELIAESNVKPWLNQFEIHPLLSQKPLVKYCRNNGIKVEAYTPIGRFDKRLSDNSILKSLADKYNKTIPQIILRWHVQNEIIPVPRTTNHKRMKENIDIFDFNLEVDEIFLIDSINQDLRLRYNPDDCDFKKL